MTKYYRNTPPPENYTKPKPPTCPPAPPSREFICSFFGFSESKESIKKGEEYLKSKADGIPYKIVGNSGIMVADADDIRNYAKDQFDKCNQYFNNQQQAQKENTSQDKIDTLKGAIKLCEEYGSHSCVDILQELLNKVQGEYNE